MHREQPSIVPARAESYRPRQLTVAEYEAILDQTFRRTPVHPRLAARIEIHNKRVGTCP